MSNINSSGVNINYPIPKVNNNSQGFRDNFSAIKSNLDQAGFELSELQGKVLLKSAIGPILDNNMNNTLISNAKIHGFRNAVYSLGSCSGAVTVDTGNAPVQTGTVDGNVAFNFAKWSPSGTYAEIQLILTKGTGGTVTFPQEALASLITLENYKADTNTISFPRGVTVLHYVISTQNCGVNISVRQVNRARKGTDISERWFPNSLGVVGDRIGDIAVDENYLYLCSADFTGVSPIWRRQALLAW